jgi:hypothetical protein
MKMPKIELGKTVENRKWAFTPNCRIQISMLGQNAENSKIRFGLLWKKFIVEKIKTRKICYQKTSKKSCKKHNWFGGHSFNLNLLSAL